MWHEGHGKNSEKSLKMEILVFAFFALFAAGWMHFIFSASRWHHRLTFAVVAWLHKATDSSCARSLICRHCPVNTHEGLGILPSAFTHMVLMWFTQHLLEIQTRWETLKRPQLYSEETDEFELWSAWFSHSPLLNREYLMLKSHRQYPQDFFKKFFVASQKKEWTPVEYYWIIKGKVGH